MAIKEEVLTIRQAAARLNEMAQLTAEHSQNWDNFEDICASMLQQAYDHGRKTDA